MPKRKPKDPERSPDLPHDWIARQLRRLESYLDVEPLDLTNWDYRRARLVGPGEYQFLDPQWGQIQVGEPWGGQDVTAFFRKTITLPATHAGPDLYLDIDLDGGETQLCINGRPWQGLDYYRRLVPLGEFAKAGRQLELSMEAFVINYPYDARRHDERDFHRFTHARLVRRDSEIEAFLTDAHFVLDAYLNYWQQDEHHELEDFFRRHLEAACRLIGPQLQTRAEVRAAVADAGKLLRANVYDSRFYRAPGCMHLCAHSHLDLVYLWPIKETFRKNCRTVTNTLSLMREFPEYRFSYSQPYLYEKLKEMYPQVYAEVRKRIREGRWEIVGAMYVEPDGNLLGGESMVRQLLFGKRFLREEFGIEQEICWLPDVFGVMYTLPQILRKCGVKYFLTAKLNIWNDTNIFPYDSFRWRGPDGSEVLAHFPPTHFAQNFTYTNLHRQWQDLRHKQDGGENLFVYGWGDGGGGPTREMVATSMRTDGFPGLPETKISFAAEFFQELETKAQTLPVWDDELYLEAHRGTYTTKGDLKRQNRRVELLYREAEILSSLAWLYGGPRVQERLNEGWKHILLNQFHDTLPGTHVHAGVPDIKQDYEHAFAIGDEVREQALAYIAGGLTADAAAHDLLLVNTLSWPHASLADIKLRSGAVGVQGPDGEKLPVQHYNGRTYFRPPLLPSLGWTTVGFCPAPPAANVVVFTAGQIETPLYTITLGADGRLDQIYDKGHDREVLTAPGNILQLFEDNPGHKFSAWDIAYHFEEQQYAVTQTVPWQLVANGPLFAVFAAEWRLLNSTLRQEMWLYAADPRIDFHTEVDWRDHQKLLKVAFPLQVRTRSATFDLPFGNIARPTHRNTSWEQAKFEVCGHKWADLSEGDYGVALLNDGKYGYDARENVLRLSLLRSPVRPDGQSDIGRHQFTYALLPHAGGWRQAHVDRRAYELNIPPLAYPLPQQSAAGHIPRTQAHLEIDAHGLIVETLKQAEDGAGLVLRTFDNHGGRVKTNLDFSVPIAEAAETNLLEEEAKAVAVVDGRFLAAHFNPYEIKTHRLNLLRNLGKEGV